MVPEAEEGEGFRLKEDSDSQDRLDLLSPQGEALGILRRTRPLKLTEVA